MEEVKSFIGQRMNLDVDEKLLKPEETREVYNALADISGTMLKFKGNTAVSTTLPAGENKVLTSAKDHARNAIIYFIWNSLGNHCIMRYREGKIERIIYGWDVLNFKLEKPVNHASVIGDLLYWTDGYDKDFTDQNPPRMINIVKAIGTYQSWNSNVAYQVGDIIGNVTDGKVYECIQDCTNVAQTNKDYWVLRGRRYNNLTADRLKWIMDRGKYPLKAEAPVVTYLDM